MSSLLSIVVIMFVIQGVYGDLHLAFDEPKLETQTPKTLNPKPQARIIVMVPQEAHNRGLDRVREQSRTCGKTVSWVHLGFWALGFGFRV